MSIPPIAQNKTPYLSVRQFVAISWKYKWFILITSAIFAVASVFIALSMPNKYESKVVLSPSEEQQGGGLSALANQFGSLASLTGINLKGKGTDTTNLALEILKSKQFLMAFIERHQLKVPVMAAKSWDIASGKLVLNENIYDEGSSTWVRKVDFPKKPEPSLLETYKTFREILTIKRDAKADIVTITMEFYSPVLVQQWLNALVIELNDYMREIELKRSRSSIEYLRGQIETTDVAELKNVFFQLVQEQIKKSMLAEVRKEYVFTIIDPAIVAEEKSGPSRAIICIVITLLGGILSLFGAHLHHFIVSTRSTPK